MAWADTLVARATHRDEDYIERQGPSAHQRKAVCVKHLVGASPVVCPCIAVIGLLPCSV
jgi:hypothetical protein